jgi:hypothetical protein
MTLERHLRTSIWGECALGSFATLCSHIGLKENYMAMIEIDAEHLQKLIERLFGMVKHLDCELLGHRMFLETLYAHGLDQTEALLTIQTAVDNPSTKAAIDSKYREMEEKIAEQLANAVK